MNFTYYFSDSLGPQELMDLDKKSLENTQENGVVLHLFRWKEPALSLGCLFDDRHILKKTTNLNSSDLKVLRVKRPTGGGVMIHGSDLCFSLAIGPWHPLQKVKTPLLYKLVHGFVAKALEKYDRLLKGRLEFFPSCKKAFVADPRAAAKRCCMSHPSIYDLKIDGRKILGAAERRKKALLYQASLHVEPTCFESVKNHFLEPASYATMIALASHSLAEIVPIDWSKLIDCVQTTLTSEIEKSFKWSLQQKES